MVCLIHGDLYYCQGALFRFPFITLVLTYLCIMKIEQIYTGCLAQGAYYIVSKGEAIIIDPLRETAPYLNRLSADTLP